MLYNVLSPEECAGLVRRTKGEQFEELSYYKSGGEGVSANISSCKLCRFRDSELAYDIFGRISNALRGTAVEQTFRRFPTPSGRQSASDTSSSNSTVKRRSSAGTGISGPTEGVVTRINLPLNVLRYDVGEFFAPHRDNTFRSGTEVSRLTLQIFLNEKFSGGVTSIRDGKNFFDIKPKMGSVLLVDQELRREECYVVSGKKYVMRADVMYDEATK